MGLFPTIFKVNAMQISGEIAATIQSVIRLFSTLDRKRRKKHKYRKPVKFSPNVQRVNRHLCIIANCLGTIVNLRKTYSFLGKLSALKTFKLVQLFDCYYRLS